MQQCHATPYPTLFLKDAQHLSCCMDCFGSKLASLRVNRICSNCFKNLFTWLSSQYYYLIQLFSFYDDVMSNTRASIVIQKRLKHLPFFVYYRDICILLLSGALWPSRFIPPPLLLQVPCNTIKPPRSSCCCCCIEVGKRSAAFSHCLHITSGVRPIDSLKNAPFFSEISAAALLNSTNFFMAHFAPQWLRSRQYCRAFPHQMLRRRRRRRLLLFFLRSSKVGCAQVVRCCTKFLTNWVLSIMALSCL